MYPWHPWFGVLVGVHEAIEKSDDVVFRCNLSGSDTGRWLEVPAWMFDRSACTRMRVADYYDGKAQIKYLREKGETLAAIGDHAGIIDTSELLATHPQGVDLARLAASPLRSEPTGYTGKPLHSLAEYGTALIEIRINAAILQIRAALSDRHALN